MELLLALATPAPKGHWGIPVLVWGVPGTGKSTFIESLAREDFPVYTMIASLHDPTDFNGLPMLVDGRMRFAPPDWVYLFEEHGQGILFLDELTTAPPTVQAALLRLVLERKVGAHSLPMGVRIVAAANPPDIAASGWELSAPLANRFVHLKWQLDGETYRLALQQGFQRATLLHTDPHQHAERVNFWRQVVTGFLQRNPGMAFTEPAEDEYAYATPRSWDFAIALMATCELHGYLPRPGTASAATAEPAVNLLKGAIGSGAATSFLQYLRQLRIPDPEAVLDGRITLNPQLREDELFVLFNTMAQLLQSMPSSDQRLPLRTKHFLQATLRAAQSRRADSAYTALRTLIRSGRLAEQVARTPDLQSIIRQLSPYYEGLTQVLEMPGTHGMAGHRGGA